MSMKFKKMEAKTKRGWTDWVFPKMDSYLMKCCDCGLVHELQFNSFIEQNRRKGTFEVIKLPKQIRIMFRARRFPVPKELRKMILTKKDKT